MRARRRCGGPPRRTVRQSRRRRWRRRRRAARRCRRRRDPAVPEGVRRRHGRRRVAHCEARRQRERGPRAASVPAAARWRPTAPPRAQWRGHARRASPPPPPPRPSCTAARTARAAQRIRLGELGAARVLETHQQRVRRALGGAAAGPARRVVGDVRRLVRLCARQQPVEEREAIGARARLPFRVEGGGGEQLQRAVGQRADGDAGGERERAHLGGEDGEAGEQLQRAASSCRRAGSAARRRRRANAAARPARARRAAAPAAAACGTGGLRAPRARARRRATEPAARRAHRACAKEMKRTPAPPSAARVEALSKPVWMGQPSRVSITRAAYRRSVRIRS